MTTYDRTIARKWLREMRGDMSQDALAADITATTGWNLTRDRYSKYESGSPTTPMGREVFQRFVNYWTAKGRPAPDMEPPAPVLSLEERAVLAAERQAAALEMHIVLLTRQTIAAETIAGQRETGTAPGRSQQAEDAVQAYVQSVLDHMPWLGQPVDLPAAPEG